MWYRTILCLVLVCFVAVFCLTLFTPSADAAADKGVSGDKALAQKSGIEGVFQSKSDANDPRAPTKTQKYIGFGSIVVMIIVVKYL